MHSRDDLSKNHSGVRDVRYLNDDRVSQCEQLV